MDDLGTIFLDSDTFSAALGDLAIAPDGCLLLATVDGSSLLALEGGGVPRLTGRLDLEGGGLGAGRDLTVLPGAEGTVLALLPGAGAPTLARLRADGRLSAGPGDTDLAPFERSLLLDTAGGPLLLATEWRSGALSSFRPGVDGGCSPLPA